MFKSFTILTILLLLGLITKVYADGCCSMDYKECDVWWCGSTKSSCENCGDDAFMFLEDGEISGSCLKRWSGCKNNINACCDELVCTELSQYYSQCLPIEDDSPLEPNTPQPSLRPTKPPTSFPSLRPVAPSNTPISPTDAPIEPTNAPIGDLDPVLPPLPEGILLTTDEGLNAWEVFLGLEELTHVNSLYPPNYALVASGGAAGDGNLVVSESQGYALLITGAVLASWDNHAGRINGASRSRVINAFEGYYNFWKDMCRNSSSQSGCQLEGNLCKDERYSGKSVCLPDWRHYKTGGSETTTPAPDGDEDAITGIMMAVKALGNDIDKPSWFDEARNWADASATAFFRYNVDKSRGDKRLLKLGACWGGWEGSGNNPSYVSPGGYRLMRDFQSALNKEDRDGYEEISADEWDKLVATSHEMVLASQCQSDGAMVPNWVTLGTNSNGNIINTGGSFSGSGTPQYVYGAEAARTTWRVALDAVLYPEKSADWSPYLSSFQVRLDDDFDPNRNGFKWSSNPFPSCRGSGTNQDITLFSNWENSPFIYGPTLSALVASSSSIPNAQAMMDAAGEKLLYLPRGYYGRSWVLLANLILSGAMEDVGKTLKSISIPEEPNEDNTPTPSLRPTVKPTPSPSEPPVAPPTKPIDEPKDELEKIYFGGRWWRDGDWMRHSWGVGTFVMRFKGSTSLVVEMGAGYEGAYFTCRVDDGPEARLLVDNSYQEPTANGMAFTGLSSTKEHVIRCGRDNEASYGDTIISGISLESGGQLLQASDPNANNSMIRFEAIGDSITAGFNVLTPALVSEPATIENQDVFQTYIRFMADAWGTTDYQVIAKSGISILDNGQTGVVMPLEWPCREYWGGWEGGCPALWDFDSWQADVVTINLGTNDFVYGDPTQQEFREGYMSFLQQVRENYPNALIACIEPVQHSCNGENYPSLTGIVNGLEQAVSDMNDPKVIYYETGSTADQWLECNSSTQDYVDYTHPTVLGNEKFASKLLEKMTDDVRKFFPQKCGGVGATCTQGAPIQPPVAAPESTPKCGCASCTQQVLDRDADGYSCGSRIDWVIDNIDSSETDACALVGGEEFPSICGGCDPNTCNNDQ